MVNITVDFDRPWCYTSIVVTYTQKEGKMKKALVLLPIVAALAACSTTSVYDKRADEARERQEKYVERSLDKAPDWMTKLPANTANVVYAAASAVSGDMAMADEKAKVIALGKICTSAGGTVDKTSKVYMLDNNNNTQERSEMAIRSKCRQVDVTGVETANIKRVSEGTRFRTYVLIALPIGDANTLKREKQADAERAATKNNSDKAFQEIDKDLEKSDSRPVSQAVPISSLNLVEVDNAEYKKRRAEALEKPGAVVGRITVAN